MKTNQKLPQLILEAPTRWTDYELLDTGEGLALERVGAYILIRPEPQAIWSKALPPSEWKKADAEMITTGKAALVAGLSWTASGDPAGKVPPYWRFPRTGQPMGLD